MIWTPKKISLFSWHRYFAWTPTKLVDGRVAWLCYIQRRLVNGDWLDWWEYKV